MSLIRKLFLVLIIFSVSAFVASCDSKANKTEVGETISDAGDKISNEMEELKTRLDGSKSELDLKIKELENQIEEVADDSRDELVQQVEALKAKRQDVNEQLEKLSSQTAETWKDFKSDTEQVLSDIKTSLK